MNHALSSASRLGILALLTLPAAAFIACSSAETSTSTSTTTTNTTTTTTGGSGGGSASASGSGGAESTSTGMGTATSTGTGGALTPDAQVAKLCADVVAPYCEALFACCMDPMILANVGGTVEGCKTKTASECTNDAGQGILPQVKAGNTTLDPTRLAACVARLQGMKAGGAACTRPPTFVLQLDCITAFQGTIAPGAACDATDLHDDEFLPCKDGVCTGGKCQAFLASGAACDPSQNNFAAGGCNYPNGELCVGTGTVGKCGPQGAVGDACGDAGHDKSFSCASMSCGPAGTCIAPTADGLCSAG
jgi:hypothetical protein